MRKSLFLFSILFFCLCRNACPLHAATLNVFVSVPPQAYLAERLGGNNVKTRVLVGSGQDPHTFEPTPRQITALGKAGIFFTIGLPFEIQIIKKIKQNNHRLAVIDTSTGIKKSRHQGGFHQNHERRREEPDLHIWLSPDNLKKIAEKILQAFIDADPVHTDNYRRNYKLLVEDIDKTKATIGTMLAPYKGRTFYVFHPAFGCFADTFGLKQKAVESEGKAPSPKHLAKLIRDAKAEKIKTIFVQPQFDKHSASTIANAINGAVIPLDPLAGDVLTNLEDIAKKIQQALD